jgi:N utilization substance protein B
MMTEAKPRPRTAARLAAVQALFQSEQTQTSPEAVIEEFVRHRLGVLPGQEADEGRTPDANVPLFARIVRVATRQQDVIDTLVSDLLPADWPLGRLDPVLRALLRAGVAELTMADGPPGKVVINEYMDVAHGFFVGDEPRMANGILDSAARRLRPQDF